MNSTNFQILEGLRGIAAFVVVLNHARGHLFAGGQAYLASADATIWNKALIGIFQITSLGPHAVIVFFVLSGFSIAHSIEAGRSVAGFYLRRAVRLGPPGLAGLLLAWLAFSTTPFPAPYGHFIAQYWSLYQEAIFYAMAPVVAATAWRVHFAAVAVVGYIVGLVVSEGGVAHNYLFQYSIYFAIGVMAYQRRDLLPRLVAGKGMLLAVTLLAMAAMVASIYIAPKSGFLMAAALSLFLIANFLHHGITNSVIRGLGAMSYTLYVTHIATIALWAWLLQRIGVLSQPTSLVPWLWMTAVPGCLITSYVVYRIAERPAVELLHAMRRTGPARRDDGLPA